MERLKRCLIIVNIIILHLTVFVRKCDCFPLKKGVDLSRQFKNVYKQNLVESDFFVTFLLLLLLLLFSLFVF